MSINIVINFENIKEKAFIFSKTYKIIDIKKKILDYYNENNENNEKYNYIELENITTKIYKDYGKLFFDKGILPSSNDNYKLENFTIVDDNRIYTFNAVLKNIEQKNKELEKKSENINNNNNKYKKNINKYDNKYYENTNTFKKEEFVFREEDFPPLK
jgi:hypothetical protein